MPYYETKRARQKTKLANHVGIRPRAKRQTEQRGPPPIVSKASLDEKLFAARTFPANPSELTCAFPRMLQHLIALKERRGVFETNGIGDFFAEFLREQCMQLAYALRGLEPTRHIAAVIIAAKSDSVLTSEF